MSKDAHLEASSKGGSVTQWRGHELIAMSDLEEIQTPKDVLRVLNQTLADVNGHTGYGKKDGPAFGAVFHN